MSVRLSAVRRLSCCSAIAALGLGLTACGSTAGGSTQTSTTHPSKGQASPSANLGFAAKGKCTPTQTPVPKGVQSIRKPTLTLNPAKRYVVSLNTNCGTIEIQLNVRQAPRTTASFAYLVKRGFYDNLTFHRVAAGFVIQGGDPNGDGSGGPGYTVVEPPPSSTRYTLGTVAMAKTGTDPAGASGSQFFIVTARDSSLPPQYALVGNVVGSLASVEAISKLPTDPPQDGAPRTPVVISRATLSSTGSLSSPSSSN
ncbi:MAG TPA: peptidylprolyl isomerase [Solirubrobacteraceae bacterium]|jgi:peptidyl-prolyl cis-trans isomerase B (cyclophilin B)|nr:peptidylprolyl isomerase [Solirubrobacteraceae bacterium]